MKTTTNQKEKVTGFIYVLLLFLAITITCCFLLFYYNSDFLVFTQKDFAVSKMDRIKEYQTIQSRSSMMVDSLFNKINKFQPMVNAVYEENDIEYIINELKNVYEQHSWDIRYKSFLHVSQFYSMWFTDKKELWYTRDNIVRIKRNLEECEIGLNTKKNELLLSSKK
ncbi:hypothetical protein AGMMS50239_25460 [Bacteroidia bacterium]|nr:hypothetical protein AGMMS50239_25460 [Bacteroidia bacterium]GHV29685.1 hypothetical protein FACS1894177_00970 [Bacteroidia bacterium]